MAEKMKRLLFTGFDVVVVLALCGSMVGCVNFSKRVDFKLYSSSKGVTTFDLDVARLGPYLNVHAGGTDVYQFDLPAGQAHVPADKILRYVANGLVRSDRPESGEIDLTIDGAGCEIRVNLTTSGGQEFLGNGIYRARSCGLTQL